MLHHGSRFAPKIRPTRFSENRTKPSRNSYASGERGPSRFDQPRASRRATWENGSNQASQTGYRPRSKTPTAISTRKCICVPHLESENWNLDERNASRTLYVKVPADATEIDIKTFFGRYEMDIIKIQIYPNRNEYGTAKMAYIKFKVGD